MGYGCYDRGDGMGERGYMVADVCHFPGCGAEIDRGLSYLCYGCTKYFCEKHLTYSDVPQDCFAGDSSQTCQACSVEVPEEDPDE